MFGILKSWILGEPVNGSKDIFEQSYKII